MVSTLGGMKALHLCGSACLFSKRADHLKFGRLKFRKGLHPRAHLISKKKKKKKKKKKNWQSQPLSNQVEIIWYGVDVCNI